VIKQAKQFVLINYSDRNDDSDDDLRPYHGKAIALDIGDKHAPFPSSFIIHEMRVRGFYPFSNTAPDIPADDVFPWQDWITTGNIWDSNNNMFRKGSNQTSSSAAFPLPQSLSMTPMGGGPSTSGMRHLELNEQVIADILAATRSMPSWKACEVEGTGWTGTTEENIQKYLSTVSIS